MRTIGTLWMVSLCLLGDARVTSHAVSKRPTPPITPAWALECWLWEDDHSTAAAILELLNGYEEHDIPARTIILDAPWSTRFNDFTIDTDRYPEPEQFFADLKRRGIRVVCWMTSMVNSRNASTKIKDSSDWFAEAKAKGYLAGGGYQQRWWQGTGGFIDYRNPEAMTWWRGMQENIFRFGIDGWKLDDAAFYFNSPLGFFTARDLPPIEERRGWMSNREYVDHFYRDEYHHGLGRVGPEFITLSRSIDTQIYPQGFCPLDCAPVTWVGDQKHTWTFREEGIEEALHFILEAARQGYCIIGSDVGGYHGSMPIPTNLHIRWAQFSTFCGLFLNGGHGERRLWKRDPIELPIIRRFAWLHNELVPFMYSHVVECHRGGKTLMRPVGPSRGGMDQGHFHYLFGEDFLIAPIHEDSLVRTVFLPEGRWRYFFEDREPLVGPREITREFPLDEFPVFVREGAVVPLDVRRPYTGLGDRDSEGSITWLVYPHGENRFTLHREKADSVEAIVQAMQNRVEIRFEGPENPPHRLRIHSEVAPSGVHADGEPLLNQRKGGWWYDAERAKLLIDGHSQPARIYTVHWK